MESAVLVIFENGERTGHITADGSIGYLGENDYIEGVLEHFEGGRIYIRPTADSHEVFGTGSVAERSSGEDLFAAVEARLEPLPTVETQRKCDDDDG